LGSPPGTALSPARPWDGHWGIQHRGPQAWGWCQGVSALLPGPRWRKGSQGLRVLLQLGDHQFLREQEKPPLAPLVAPGQPHVRAQHRSLPAEQSAVAMSNAAAAGPACARVSLHPVAAHLEPQQQLAWPIPPGTGGPSTCTALSDAGDAAGWRERVWGAGCQCLCPGSAARPEPASSQRCCGPAPLHPAGTGAVGSNCLTDSGAGLGAGLGARLSPGWPPHAKQRARASRLCRICQESEANS